MKCTPAEDDVWRVRPRGCFLGQLEAVARDVGELDHLVALIVVAQDEDLVPESSPRVPCAFDQTRVRRCWQLTGTLDAALGGELAALAEDEQRQRRATWLFRCGAHAAIVCRCAGDAHR